MRALLIEDNIRLARTLMAELGAAGLVLDSVADGLHADQLLRSHSYDVVILDLSLPGLDGLEVLRRLRERGDEVPVLVLTASFETPDRVRGLNAGADDYLPKPFDFSELVARLRAVARRRLGHARPQVRVGRLGYDELTLRFYVDDQSLMLPPREHGLLEILMLRAGRPVSKHEVSERLCSLDQALSPEAVEVYVHRLRRRLDGSGTTIRTLRGLGYCLEADAAAAPPAAADAPA